MVNAGGLVDQRKDIMKIKHANVKVRYVKKPIKKSNKKTKDPRLLQKLFDSCREAFKGPGTVPADSDVNKLCSILDKMIPKHVGLSKNMHFFKSKSAVKGTPRVAYTAIYQCHEFSICIFFLPANAVIPLHNHPGMTVFSKLLVGKLHIKSYDWVDHPNSQHPMAMPPSSQLRLARLKADGVIKAPCETSVLYPTTGGNIHEFRAITPCAVLDVLGPPYSKEDDRDCSYYKDLPVLHGVNEEDDLRWLEENQAPENSEMDRIEYLGPQLIESTLL
ncbi:plant cysteine oxidase 2-like [Hibiscus syriacus]|uniref:plant cysteine oxidase 2-like n=1 Tax=Hibiscus syriacus TaxID=106335 RepID=UPI0019223B0C|nr:plant cysteine oxidase 2-like [Hibiscus syriacus]